MISMTTEKAVAYALGTLQERGQLFVEPGTECYEGMIVGERSKAGVRHICRRYWRFGREGARRHEWLDVLRQRRGAQHGVQQLRPTQRRQCRLVLRNGLNAST